MVPEPLLTNVVAASSSSSSPIQSTVSNLSKFSNIVLPNYNFPFKLEIDNYVIWRSQIIPAIVGCNMEGFIDGSLVPPVSTITENTTEDGQTVQKVVSNPEFRQWLRLFNITTVIYY